MLSHPPHPSVPWVRHSLTIETALDRHNASLTQRSLLERQCSLLSHVTQSTDALLPTASPPKANSCGLHAITRYTNKAPVTLSGTRQQQLVNQDDRRVLLTWAVERNSPKGAGLAFPRAPRR